MCLPSVADKVVQAALLQVIEPLAEKMFSDCSYAYRPEKGHYKAIWRIEHSLNNRKKTWAVPRDIENFFDSINHNRLIEQFSALVQGEPVMTELVSLWCRMGLVEKKRTLAERRGRRAPGRRYLPTPGKPLSPSLR